MSEPWSREFQETIDMIHITLSTGHASCPHGMFSFYSFVRDVPPTACKRKDAYKWRHKIADELRGIVPSDLRHSVHGDRFFSLSALKKVLGRTLRPGTEITVDRSGIETDKSHVRAKIGAYDLCDEYEEQASAEVNPANTAPANTAEQNDQPDQNAEPANQAEQVNHAEQAGEGEQTDEAERLDEAEQAVGEEQVNGSLHVPPGEQQSSLLTLDRVMDRIRRVDEGGLKGHGSILDVIKLVTGNRNVRNTWMDMKADVTSGYDWSIYKFPGERQRDTPVAPVETLIQIVWECPGVAARAFRRQFVDVLKQAFADTVSLNNGSAEVLDDATEGVIVDPGEVPGELQQPPSLLTFDQVMSRIRRVTEGDMKGYGSVLDVIQLVTGNSNPRDTWTSIKCVGSSDTLIWTSACLGQGRARAATPVAPVETLIQIVWECPGVAARAFRRQCADLIKRVFENDVTLADEIRAGAASTSAASAPDLLVVQPDPVGTGGESDRRDSRAVEAFCGVTCSRELDLRQLLPVPGLSSNMPALDVMKRHGNYFFVLGMSAWNGATVLIVRPGASFHGIDGMYARYSAALREFPHLCVMFMEPSTATSARDGENVMEHALSALGNVFQIGNTEKWVVTVAPGMQVADAARGLADHMHKSLPPPRLNPASAPVPDEVSRAFREAVASVSAVDAACGVKGRMWADETGHRYDVEAVHAESELERHRVNKQTEKEMEIEKLRTQAELAKYDKRVDSLQDSLARGLISQEQYIAALNF